MPYVTSIERLARVEAAREELLRLIRGGLKKKFGLAGVRLMRKVRAVDDLRRLRRLAEALMGAESLEDFRGSWNKDSAPFVLLSIGCPAVR